VPKAIAFVALLLIPIVVRPNTEAIGREGLWYVVFKDEIRVADVKFNFSFQVLDESAICNKE